MRPGVVWCAVQQRALPLGRALSVPPAPRLLFDPYRLHVAGRATITGVDMVQQHAHGPRLGDGLLRRLQACSQRLSHPPLPARFQQPLGRSIVGDDHLLGHAHQPQQQRCDDAGTILASLAMVEHATGPRRRNRLEDIGDALSIPLHEQDVLFPRASRTLEQAAHLRILGEHGDLQVLHA